MKVRVLNIRKRKPSKRDKRINAGLISVREIVLMAIMLFLFTIIQVFVIINLTGQTGALRIVLWETLAFSTFLFMALFNVFKRLFYSRPMQVIAEAAREIAEGDYSIRIAPLRKDGRKDAVEVLIDDFNTMAERLGSTEMLKNDFIANVSHEIKTPLSIVQAYSQFLRDPDITEEERLQYTDTIMEATRKLNIMISNILKLNKLEHQDIEPECRVYQLGEQLRRCALGYRNQWLKKNIFFDIDVADVPVYLDDALMEIVWNNLLSNAIKFSDTGGRISLTSQLQKEEVIVRLQDHGCGMNEEVQKRIFEKFYQGDSSHSREGNGLGLALVKKILDMSGGTIFVESREGEGTTFLIHLPVSQM